MNKEEIGKLKEKFYVECTSGMIYDVYRDGHSMWQWIYENCLNVQEEKDDDRPALSEMVACNHAFTKTQTIDGYNFMRCSKCLVEIY